VKPHGKNSGIFQCAKPRPRHCREHSFGGLEIVLRRFYLLKADDSQFLSQPFRGGMLRPCTVFTETRSTFDSIVF